MSDNLEHELERLEKICSTTKEQREAASEGIIDLLYHCHYKQTDKTKARIKEAIRKFQDRLAITEDELEDAEDRVLING